MIGISFLIYNLVANFKNLFIFLIFFLPGIVSRLEETSTNLIFESLIACSKLLILMAPDKINVCLSLIFLNKFQSNSLLFF